jgi:hypothetical protein
MAASQFYVQSGKYRKVETIVKLFFVKKFRYEKRKCETVHCHNARARSFAAKVRGEVFAYFHAVAVKCLNIIGIDCLASQDEFFVENLLISKKMMSMFLTFLLTCLAFFDIGEFGLSVYGSCFLNRMLV